MRNAANVSRAIHRMDFSQLQEKVSKDFRRFVSEKMKENEHCPLVPSSLGRRLGKLHFQVACFD